MADQAVIIPAVFVVAALYASVGHGGASGYLALLSLSAYAPEEMKTTALLLNVVVAGIAWRSYQRAGHLSWPLTWPFLVTSIPAAFIGGAVHVAAPLYLLLLGGSLVVAAWRLAWVPPTWELRAVQPPPLRVALPAGGALGLVSGMVGVGGGIFLSPLMILLRWADARTVSATAAVFIVVNSVAGLAGHAAAGKPFDALGALPLLLPAVAGGSLGAWLGARRFTVPALRRVLALVLLAAAAKLVIVATRGWA